MHLSSLKSSALNLVILGFLRHYKNLNLLNVILNVFGQVLIHHINSSRNGKYIN